MLIQANRGVIEASPEKEKVLDVYIFVNGWKCCINTVVPNLWESFLRYSIKR